MEELLDKCQHLLKPIRDLEQNWSVDLSNELTQALVSLNAQMISFGQNGDKIIDFSKAAMIIQGSANVYSKKVDYLYKAVYEMKEWMEKLWEVEKKGKSNRSKVPGDDAADLALDDQEEDNLDLSISEDDRFQLNESDELLSYGTVLLPPKPSMLSGCFNIKIPLKSLSGDVIGYMNDFHINSVDVVPSMDYQLPMTAAPVQHDATCDENHDIVMEDDDDYNNETLEQVPELAVSDVPNNGTPVRVEKQAPTRQLRPRTAPLLADQPQEKVVVDPWTQLLDPHSAVQHRPSKALKPGNCRVLPPSLRKGKKRRQNGTYTKEKHIDDIATFCAKEYSNELLYTGGNSLLFPEFKVLFTEILKNRHKELKAIKLRSKYIHAYEAYDAPDLDGDLDGGSDEEAGDYEDDHPIPFSRLHDTELPLHTTATDELPVGYSELLAQVVQKECDDLATQNDKLTEIDKRVKTWENSVRGAIETAETRPAFDMLHYSDFIFNSFTGGSDMILMNTIFEGKPKYEAFRTFVSALILANHGNIEICEDDDQVHLSLLHKTTLSDVIASDTTNRQ